MQITNPLKDIVAALQFLTVMPLPFKTEMANLKRGVGYYPLAGAVTGLVVGGLNFGLQQILPGQLSAALAVIFYAIFTRGLHLDGLMDCCDAFFSYKSREVMLKIMKESTVGSFAVIAGGGWLLVFWQIMAVLSWQELTAALIISRSAVLILPLAFDYVRESGTGKFFAESVNLNLFQLSLILTILLLALISPLYLIVLAPCWMIVLMWGKFAYAKIGGYTGDVLGAAMEIGTVVSALILILFR